ncbi:hypothetical protein ACLF4E_003585 [Cronobacter malonaticus]
MKAIVLLVNILLFVGLYLITIPLVHFWRPLTRQEIDWLVESAEWFGFLNAQQLWWLLMATADFIVALVIFILMKIVWRRLVSRYNAAHAKEFTRGDSPIRFVRISSTPLPQTAPTFKQSPLTHATIG